MSHFSPSNIFVSFSGATGTQFGRNIFITTIPFKAAERFLVVFEEVQRKINKKRAKSIANYILNGLHRDNYCFLSAVTATCRGYIKYEEATNQVSIDINSNLSINDGQHRVEGIKMALDIARKDAEKANGSRKNEALERLSRLEEMCIPVVIFDNMSKAHEQQLFHDLNLLASKPTKSVSLKFDNTDLYNRMAKELAATNETLVTLGVDMEKTSLSEKREELMVLSTLRNTISYMIAGTDKDNNGVLNLDNYTEKRNEVSEIIDSIFEEMPDKCYDRSQYIIGLAATIQGIGKYVHYLINDFEEDMDVDGYLVGIGRMDWSHSNPKLNGYGGSYDESKRRFVFSGTGSGINGICNFLKDNNKKVDRSNE
ncbi:DNA sulfur modification protein DndB [Tumebacillus flagellatus]|uniref:DGQHR domain-containing protein n=1 Tax=Tumebacillus flagellatus TaxID=1157490 RepID=A0A074LRR0_9BACL|nr:DNA sulfur modification protein DndB [Tumebacillus flagellatus]KEO83155.1 hypothetical protein EL26_11845 [Tumebacillus flagellatus]